MRKEISLTVDMRAPGDIIIKNLKEQMVKDLLNEIEQGQHYSICINKESEKDLQSLLTTYRLVADIEPISKYGVSIITPEENYLSLKPKTRLLTKLKNCIDYLRNKEYKDYKTYLKENKHKK